jgi:hypothetical protein
MLYSNKALWTSITIFLAGGLNSKKLYFLPLTVLVLKHAEVTGNVGEPAEVIEQCKAWIRDPVVGEGSTCKAMKQIILQLQSYAWLHETMAESNENL